MILLAFRVAWIQVVNADELTRKAIDQQTSDVPIEAKRGNIYDRNGNELATSVICYSLWVRPAELAEVMDEEQISQLAEDLSAVIGDDVEDIRADLVRDRLSQGGPVSGQRQAEKVRDMEISALSLSEGTRRYYPWAISHHSCWEA